MLLDDFFFADIEEVDLADYTRRANGGSGNTITDSDLGVLAPLTGLTRLILDGAQLTGSGLTYLKEPTRLRELEFYRCGNLTDAGLRNVQRFTGLKYLNLNCTGVTDAGLTHIGSLSHLEWLNLAGTRLTDEGAKKLQQALPKCHIVR
jgi:Leucine-rich repeat (LRR) protein